jgi:serine/threonine-protein kinase
MPASAPAPVPPPPTTVTVTQTPEPSAQVDPTAPRQAARSDADLRFLRFLNLVSAIPVLITDPAVLTAGGRSICVDLQNDRYTPSQIAAANVGTNGMTYAQTGGIVNAAITAYCPGYQGVQ